MGDARSISYPKNCRSPGTIYVMICMYINIMIYMSYLHICIYK